MKADMHSFRRIRSEGGPSVDRGDEAVVELVSPSWCVVVASPPPKIHVGRHDRGQAPRKGAYVSLFH